MKSATKIKFPKSKKKLCYLRRRSVPEKKRKKRKKTPKVKKEEMHSDLSDGCFNH